MTTSIDKAKIREIVLELIRTDEEFRLTIAGAIGLQNILEELKRIHEDIKKLWLKSLEHDKRFDEINRRISRLELGLVALTESFFSKSILDDLRARTSARGEKIIGWERNARVDESDIDLLVETDKSVYVVEVKVKPKHEDVGGLLAKLDVVKKKYPGKNVVGVLAGAMIGREVKEYALRKNILVYAY